VSGEVEGRAPFARYRALMAAHGFRPSRRFGQNFLLEPALHRAIADAVEVGAEDLVLEVGPGLGFLTRELAARAAAVIAVEIDPRLCRILRGELSDLAEAGARVELLESDVLGRGGVLAGPVEDALARARPGRRRELVVANLPYAVTGPFLAAAVQARGGIPDAMALLVQLELAERLAAAPGTPAYGGLSALVQAGYAVDLLRRVGREVFRPRPNVDSAIVRLRRREDAAFGRLGVEARTAFARFLRLVFAARRKTLRHGLARAGAELGLRFDADPELLALRAEALGGDRLLELFGSGRAGSPP
jgi:16S rRNA (adenine1518-N6/adenine1519-N6)-dimethyltransferase